jgi:hypothetical protein
MTLSNMIASGQGNSKLNRAASKVSTSARIASIQYGRRYGRIRRRVSRDRFTAPLLPSRRILQEMTTPERGWPERLRSSR